MHDIPLNVPEQGGGGEGGEDDTNNPPPGGGGHGNNSNGGGNVENQDSFPVRLYRMLNGNDDHLSEIVLFDTCSYIYAVGALSVSNRATLTDTSDSMFVNYITNNRGHCKLYFAWESVPRPQQGAI